MLGCSQLYLPRPRVPGLGPRLRPLRDDSQSRPPPRCPGPLTQMGHTGSPGHHSLSQPAGHSRLVGPRSVFRLQPVMSPAPSSGRDSPQVSTKALALCQQRSLSRLIPVATQATQHDLPGSPSVPGAPALTASCRASPISLLGENMPSSPGSGNTAPGSVPTGFLAHGRAGDRSPGDAPLGRPMFPEHDPARQEVGMRGRRGRTGEDSM